MVMTTISEAMPSGHAACSLPGRTRLSLDHPPLQR